MLHMKQTLPTGKMRCARVGLNHLPHGILRKSLEAGSRPLAVVAFLHAILHVQGGIWPRLDEDPCSLPSAIKG